jgi:parallel beta-helix repeat protein
VEKTANNTISNCFFHTNGEGIAIKESHNILVRSNDFTHNGLGINSDHSSFIKIYNCYATINGIGIFLNDSTHISIHNTASFNNNDNQGGIFLNNCEQINLENSRVEHNGFGIKPFDCKNIFINESTIQHNTHVGVFAERTTDLYLNHCLLTKNFRYSINAANSVLSVHNSNLIASLVGLYAEDSVIYATGNYWGSSFGPVFFEHPIIDRVRVKSSKIDLCPVSSDINNAGASWIISSSRCKIPSDLWLHPVININGTDSDGDGATDSWEEHFGYDAFVSNDHQHLDPDNDGLSNIEECYTESWGSNPYQKDIFLEVDWMASQTGPPNQNRLTNSDIKMMEDIFKEQGINLHVDHGELGGGEEVLYQSNFSYADLRDIYWNYFLHEDLNNPRKGVFHYCIINDWGPGPGFAFVGWDGLDSFDISAQELTENQPSKDRNILIVGGSIHELGHTLGLTVDDHQGNDNQIATWIFSKQWWQYRQYKSCMNYWYTYRIFGFSDGSHGPYDFDDWNHMDLSFFKNTHFDLPEQVV